ncbi:MAG: hypothetical protein J6T40_00530 [Clostridiales bacterium]|nr:hypothetical protein [Clostridiales bacterium]
MNRLVKTLTAALACALIIPSFASAKSLSADTSKVKIDSTNFSYVLLRYMKEEGIDRNKDGYLTKDEVKLVRTIEILDPIEKGQPTDCDKGLEYFYNTTRMLIKCGLTSIDITKNPNLESIGFDGNKLTELDISKCPKMRSVSCEKNQIKELDLVMNETLLNRMKGCFIDKGDGIISYNERITDMMSYIVLCCDNDVKLVTKREVSGLAASAAGKYTVSIKWNSAKNAEGYLVYAQKDGHYGYVGMTSNTSFIDKKALDTDYNYYWVFPYNMSDSGKMIVGTCAKYTFAKGVTSAVKNLRANGTKGKVTLSWTASEGADGYLIYGIRPGGSYGYIGTTTTGTTFVDTKASTENWTYYWVYPYHMDMYTMIVGGTAPYVYSKAR